ncbi:hypothetical protein N431DRAFT_499227 [Stipitochalara longipes BDJ]|nr:hypothetical protein N431DRAFT_499227 [Stipitochalara longipes BDJ]
MPCNVAVAQPLSKLVNTPSCPLQSQTSVELLRFRQPLSRSLFKELYETLGDEIINHIAGENYPHYVGEEVRAGSDPEALANEPYLQFIFLSSLRNMRGCTTNQVGITQNTLLKCQSGGCFHTYDDEGGVETITGFYHYFNEWHLGPLHTWFSYNIKSKCTTYLLFDCPQNLINKHYQHIFNWHENNGTMDPPLNRHINAIDSMQTLHQLSRTWNMIYEDLGDLEERLDFLLSTSDKLSATGIQSRIVTSFRERTKLIINFVFSLANQEIARQAQRENSSMMTLVFFEAVLQVSNKLWQFFAITIPATILVLVVYQVWRRTREGKLLSNSSDLVGESPAKNVPVGGA